MIRSRIAPTPNGFLHLGNAVSFILTSLVVKTFNGTLLLRIDDLDAERTRDEYVEDIFEFLDWLGIIPDTGPSDVNDFKQNWSQQNNLDRYNKLIADLIQTNKVFACECSRSQIGEAKYPGTCCDKKLDITTPDTALRLDTRNADQVEVIELLYSTKQQIPGNHSGPFVIRGKNKRPAYHVASLSDDLLYQINFIVRGADLWEATGSQLYMAKITGGKAFEQAKFLHHPLLHNAHGQKLSKSAGATSVKQFKDGGGDIRTLYQTAGEWLGLGLSNVNIDVAIEMLQEKIVAMLE